MMAALEAGTNGVGHPAALVLEDGSVFAGQSVGAEGEWVGEVVFNTSMTGYQEIITDPSYWGQMVAFTCPHIGNVGVNEEDVESRLPYVRAVLARQICMQPSNWRATRSLHEYLRAHGVPALSGLDARRLTLILREKGVMRAALSTVNLDVERLLEMARTAPDMSDLSPVAEVTVESRLGWGQMVTPRWVTHAADDVVDEAGAEGPTEDRPHVVVIDCGSKYNILRLLTAMGARVTVVPSGTGVAEIMALRPDGVLITNGPGDPEQAADVVDTARDLMGRRVPLFGLCLGHQIIALAAGARTYKLPFGHHGGNHPVQERASGRIEITAQNHNYAVAVDSLEGLPLEVTRVNLYDGTVEGLRHLELPVVTVQYHPEASPGRTIACTCCTISWHP
jgi:carbamoyl-phosphate synthase small subunit